MDVVNKNWVLTTDSETEAVFIAMNDDGLFLVPYLRLHVQFWSWVVRKGDCCWELLLWRFGLYRLRARLEKYIRIVLVVVEIVCVCLRVCWYVYVCVSMCKCSKG